MGKIYKIEVLRPFTDMETGNKVEVKSTMLVDKDRAINIIERGLGRLISITKLSKENNVSKSN